MERRSEMHACHQVRGKPGTWCGYCYENLKGRAAHRGHLHYRSPPTRRVNYGDFAVKRPSQAARPKKGDFVCPDRAFQSIHPELAKSLCDPWWDDGKPRKVSTLKVWMDEDAVHLCLTDPDSKLVAFTTASGLTEALVELEAALAEGTLGWKKSKY